MNPCAHKKRWRYPRRAFSRIGTQRVDGSKHADQVSIRTKQAKDLLLWFSGERRGQKAGGENGLTDGEFKCLVTPLKMGGCTKLATVLQRPKSEGGSRTCPSPYKRLLSELDKTFPICGMLQTASDTAAEVLDTVLKLARGEASVGCANSTSSVQKHPCMWHNAGSGQDATWAIIKEIAEWLNIKDSVNHRDSSPIKFQPHAVPSPAKPLPAPALPLVPRPGPGLASQDVQQQPAPGLGDLCLRDLGDLRLREHGDLRLRGHGECHRTSTTIQLVHGGCLLLSSLRSALQQGGRYPDDSPRSDQNCPPAARFQSQPPPWSWQPDMPWRGPPSVKTW
ncbi:Hypp3530 [Branchiostoma lanceolatum]|uniref:Hypp3530 protein n=1 Tax=Branchiostoma lanceolatum TaxID=7740 RepID=A0A8K0EUN3_BRALA|nr:Hypp3530 [Branchiostoma lanceolatum]